MSFQKQINIYINYIGTIKTEQIYNRLGRSTRDKTFVDIQIIQAI